MSNPKLAKYTKAAQAVADFKKKHAKMFDEYSSLLVKEQDAEMELKAEVRDNVKATIANDFIKVTYTPVWRKWYDADIIIGRVSPKVKKQMLDEGVIITKIEIDKKKLEDFVESGKVPAEIKQAAFNEAESTPRITIKAKSDE